MYFNHWNVARYLAAALIIAVAAANRGYRDVPCQWKSLSGAFFDLQPLTITDQSKPSYFIKDGDIPCTPEHEPTYSYTWNLCAPVTDASFPPVCRGSDSSLSSALQFLNRSVDGYKECELVGEYDAAHDDASFALLDIADPSKGVSMTYRLGDKCGSTGNLYRSATIDVQCANEHAVVESALELEKCAYHFVMKSYHGCPKTCPVTHAGGLCNSHGHCAYDKAVHKARCFCNEGYQGSDACHPTSHMFGGGGGSANGGTSTNSVLVTVLSILLAITVLLVLAMVYMAYVVMKFRKQQQVYHLSTTGGGDGVGSGRSISAGSGYEL